MKTTLLKILTPELHLVQHNNIPVLHLKHAVGTAKAIEMGEVEGAMSGLALSLSAISTSFMIPLLINTILKL